MPTTDFSPPPPRPRPPAGDARHIITQEAFRLDPSLLGTPLARPWRRGAAMAVDGLLIALLANAPGVLLALAAALVLFRVSGRGRDGAPRGGWARALFRFWGAVILFVAVVVGSDSVGEWVERRAGDGVQTVLGADEQEAAPPGDAARTGGGRVGVDVSGRDGLRVAAEVARFSTADDEAEARERLRTLVPALRRAGMNDDDVVEVLGSVARAPEKPWLAAVTDSAIAALHAESGAAPEALPTPDSLALAYAAALAGGDSTAAAALRPRLASALAADSLTALQAALREQRRERDEAARAMEAAQERADNAGILSTLRSLADDLGLGFGWAGLYFTGFVALWGGLTPGKRLLGVRIIRLDGRPIGWWAAFERFGGYAAGIATGLFGFFQIFWDRNRQAVHDKIAETVVIRVRA